MANLVMNITLIFSLALLVSTVTAACKPNDDSWILMDAPVGGTPTGSFDFDNLGFSIRTPWSYFDSPLAVYNDGAGQVAYIGGATGNLYNYIFQASGGSTWDGGAVWDGFGDKPGYYWLTNDPDNTCYLSFVNPVAIVTLRAQGDANAASINTIEAYDVNDTLIACYSDINERGGTNRYFDLGFRTSIPMKKLVFKGIISMDNFQFSDPLCQPDSCDTNAWCFNNLANSGVMCSCKTGYSGEGSVGTCTDKNECDLSVCAAHATCTNLPGTYNCTCNEGYEGDGFTNCTDINECDIGLCSPNAVCVNYEPGFNCTCNDGYEGDGLTCTDKNECATNPCDVNASCTNTEGSFTCACNDGYTGDGNTCTKIETPTAPTAAPTSSPKGKVSSAGRLSSLCEIALLVVAVVLML